MRRLNEGEGTWMGHILEHVAKFDIRPLAMVAIGYWSSRLNNWASMLPSPAISTEPSSS